MFIKKVIIENFKQFAKLDVDLSPFVCLVGPNNSGKTTLLQALALFRFCVNHCLSKKNGPNGTPAALELKNRSIPPEEFFAFPLASALDLWTNQIYRKGNQLQAVRVKIVFNNGATVTSEIKLNFNLLGISVSTDDESAEWLEKIWEYQIAYLPVFSAFQAREERRTRVAIQDELAVGRVSSVIRNLILDLNSIAQKEVLVETLARAFPELKNFAINFDEDLDRHIKVTYTEAERPKALDLISAGSGFQQFIYLFGFVALHQPAVILLDEPDVHLHGTLQKTLLNELRRLVASGKQVLFATHSDDLINGTEPENILFLEDGKAQKLSVGFDRYDVLDRLGSLSPAQLPKAQVHGRVLVFENKSDQDLIGIFCSKILGTRIWQQIERRVAVCYAKGNPCRQPITQLRDQLHQMLGPRDTPLKMFVVADRDYYPDLESLYQSKTEPHILWHIWERTEIENYLLALDVILRIPAEENYDLLADPLEKEFDRLIESSRDNAHDHLVEAYQRYKRDQDEGWSATDLSKKAREYLKAHWEEDKLGLADAKEVVLPGLKRWLQENHQIQFSDKALAEKLEPKDLPPEVHTFARKLADFAGVAIED